MHARAGNLAFKAKADAFARRDFDDDLVRGPLAGLEFVAIGKRTEQIRGRLLELNDNFGALGGQALAGAQVERRARPAPVVKMQCDGGEGFSRGSIAQARVLVIGGLFGVAIVLPQRAEFVTCNRCD